MTKVTIKALSGETNAKDLKILDGIKCGHDFVEYLDEDFAAKLESGYMSFKLENGKLYTLTEYAVKEPLTQEELDKLAKYTQGQWSDGIGESFEQFGCAEENGEEVFVSPWYRDQKLEIITE